MIVECRTMKGKILRSLQNRYDEVESDEALATSTLLDPKFKDKFFSGAIERANAKELLQQEADDLKKSNDSLNLTETISPKRHQNDDHGSDLWKSFSETLEENGRCIGDESSGEVDKFLAEPLLKYQTGSCFA